MIKSGSIQRNLLVNILLLITVLSSAIIAITYLGNRHAIRKFSSHLISQSIETTKTKLSSFFRPVISELLLARTWGAQGVLDSGKPIYLRQLLQPILQQYNQISSLMIADTRGREFMLLNTGDEWINRITKRDLWKSRVRWTSWTTSFSEKNKRKSLKKEWRKLDYDPRKRPWFIGAIADEKRMLNDNIKRRMKGRMLVSPIKYLHWTQPYTFYTSREPGITASIAYKLKDGITRVIGFDVLLTEISKFTTSLKVSENGKVVILTDDSRIIGLPRAERYKKASLIKQDLLKRPSELKDKLVYDAITAYTARTFIESETTPDEVNRDGPGPIRFVSNNAVWFAEIRHFSLSENRSLLIAALIPEKDLIGDLSQLRIWIILVTLAVMAVAVSRSISLARMFSKPILTLMKQSERISRGLLYEGAAIESPIIEVQRLADAHEKMRVALKSLLKLENDIYLARQIQQNTFPKKLPELPGFDIYAWSQPADETGGDTYDVIGYAVDQADNIILDDENPEFAVLLMADATGHGIGPALSANEVRAMLRMAVRIGEPIESIAVHINQQLYHDLHQGRFITSWLCLIDAKSSTLTHFSAGQAPIIYYTAKDDKFDIRSADSPPLGILPDLEVNFNFDQEMKDGDIMAVISDGVFEAMNTESEKFGEDKVLDIIKNNSDKMCADIMSALHSELNAFTRDAPANDDKTVILIKKI